MFCIALVGFVTGAVSKESNPNCMELESSSLPLEHWSVFGQGLAPQYVDFFSNRLLIQELPDQLFINHAAYVVQP